MRNFSKTCQLEEFETISTVTKDVYTTSLVQDPFSSRRYIKKEASLEKLPIYEKLQLLKHPGLAEIIDIIKKENKIIILIEYISGNSLQKILAQKTSLEEIVALSYLRQLASILNIIHQNGIIHRDVTPSNIIITMNGQVKLIDFDIARFYKSNQTEDTQLLGTPGYAAPEQFGFSQTTASTDIYALGVLLNVMITGMKPNKMKIKSRKLARIVGNCTAMDPLLRYQDVVQLDYDLRNLKQNIRITPPKRMNKTKSSRKIIIVFTSILTLLLVIVLIFWQTSQTPTDQLNTYERTPTIVLSTLSALAPELDTFNPAPEIIFTTLGNEDNLGGTFMYASGHLDSWRSEAGATAFYLDTDYGMLAVVTHTDETFETYFDFGHLHPGSHLRVYFIYHALPTPLGSVNGIPVKAVGSIVGFVELPN